MSTNIFQETPEPNSGVNPETPASPNPLDTILSSIKNERGEQKYRTVEEALNGLAHAQSYISTIKSENSVIAANLEKAQAQLSRQEELERIVNDLATRQNKQTETPAATFDEAKLTEMIENKLLSNKAIELAQVNVKQVQDVLLAKFGDKVGEVVNSKATELGLTKEEIGRLAAQSPKAVLTMFGVSGSDARKQSTQAPSSSTLNTTDFAARRNSLVGNREAFSFRPGHTNRDVEEMVDRSAALLNELQETDGLSLHDLTNPSNFFKYLR